MAKAKDTQKSSERRISDSRLTKVKQDLSTRARQLSTWEKKVEIVTNEISAFEDNAANRPTIIVLESDRVHFQSKADRLKKQVDNLSKTQKDYISKNARLDNKQLGIE
jgi:hypothetical protein